MHAVKCLDVHILLQTGTKNNHISAKQDKNKPVFIVVNTCNHRGHAWKNLHDLTSIKMSYYFSQSNLDVFSQKYLFDTERDHYRNKVF